MKANDLVICSSLVGSCDERGKAVVRIAVFTASEISIEQVSLLQWLLEISMLCCGEAASIG